MTDDQASIPPPPPPPPPETPPPSGAQRSSWSHSAPEDVRAQVGKADERGSASSAAWQGDGSLLHAPVLVVNQKAKLFELENEYGVYDEHGAQIGAVRQVGQSWLRKLFRLVGNYDQFLTHRFEIVDAVGTVVLRVTRPAKFLKSRFVIQDGSGAEVGQIVQDNVVGKKRFRLEAGGSVYGTINAENWRAWDFSIRDHTEAEVARVTKTWEGLAKAMFTTADNYVVRIHRPLDDPLRALVVASALSIDTALKQDAG